MKARSAVQIAAGLFGIVFVYAVARYVVFGAVAATEIPFYIINKTLAVTGTSLLALTVGLGPYSRLTGRGQNLLALRKDIAFYGFGMIAGHLITTLVLSGPIYFPKFYNAEGGRMNFSGQLASLCGLVGFGIYSVLSVTSITAIRKSITSREWTRIHNYGVIATGLSVLHIGIIAYPSWLTVDKWPLYMLPLTMISSAAGSVAVYYRIKENMQRTVEVRTASPKLGLDEVLQARNQEATRSATAESAESSGI